MGFMDVIGDPAGYLTGTNTEGFGGVKKMLFGDPDAIKKAYDDAMAKSMGMGQQTKNFLMGQQAQALKYYQPMQQMFNSMYGTKGLTPAQAPVGPMASYGGR